MPKVDIWMPIYIGDYLRDTQDLTAEDHGAYMLLLMHYWQKNGDIGADIKKLSIVARSSIEITKAILDEFFTLEEEGYKNKRADEELEAANNRSDSARNNAKKRWEDAAAMRAQCGGNAGGDAESMPNGCSSSSSSSSSSESSSPSEKEKEPFVSVLDNPVKDGCARIETARNAWNEAKAGPPCRLIAITFPPQDREDCLRIMTAYSDELIAEAIGNYAKIRASPEHEVPSPYRSFAGFMRGGVEKFVAEADPWSAYKKRDKGFETAGEREDRLRREAIARLKDGILDDRPDAMTPDEQARLKKEIDEKKSLPDIDFRAALKDTPLGRIFDASG